jgi:predicted TIM-barrel fold metal-dependent hydrolase
VTLAEPFIDAHLHLWELERFRYPWLADPGAEGLGSDYLVEDFRADVGELPLIASVHVQAEIDHALDPVAETSWLAELAAAQDADPVPTVCVGYADLRAPDLDAVLDRHAEHRLFRGIRQEAWFDPDSTRADIPRENLLDDPAWAAGLRCVAERGLSFDLLVWARQLEQAAAIVRELPEFPLVLEHTGLPVGPDPAERDVWRRGMRRFAAQVPHALLKISALRSVSPAWDPGELGPPVREAIDIFGPQRCLFASNFPVDRPAVAYADLWAAYDRFTEDLDARERAAMFRGNAARVYRIEVAG